MLLIDHLKSFLLDLGFFKKTINLILLGLENSGKSTLLRMLSDSNLYLAPIAYSHIKELTIRNINIKNYEVGPYESPLKFLESISFHINGIIFIVDASDKNNFELAKCKLKELLQAQELENIPFAVLGNKIDIFHAVSLDEFKFSLGLDSTSTSYIELFHSGPKPIEIFMCSAIKKIGYSEAFKWLEFHFSN